MAVEQRRVDSIVFSSDLYPRIDPDPKLIQRYAQNLEMMPPIEINQNNVLIDGYHRWRAHQQNGVTEIAVEVTETQSDVDLLKLSALRNAASGWQLDDPSKRSLAIRLYNAGEGISKAEIADIIKVTTRSVNSYLSDIDKQLRKERKETIFKMWLACHTQQEIADVVGIDQANVSRETDPLCVLENFPNRIKLHANFNDEGFTPKHFNIWTFHKKTNEVSHFGNSEQGILENLLYSYTEPFDIIVDPFAGGGATIDVCKKRLRRYWVSDRKPIPAREVEIRKYDIKDGAPPINKRWSDVRLTYLDPPYWKQAEGKYSDDGEDLSNMSIEDFTDALSNFIRQVAQKQRQGIIALLMQPTQWKAPNRQVVDHVYGILRATESSKRLNLIQRISVPYATEQYNAQQVEWAKANREFLVLTRELIIWRLTNS